MNNMKIIANAQIFIFKTVSRQGKIKAFKNKQKEG